MNLAFRLRVWIDTPSAGFVTDRLVPVHASLCTYRSFGVNRSVDKQYRPMIVIYLDVSA
jgi:hypothetical protein